MIGRMGVAESTPRRRLAFPAFALLLMAPIGGVGCSSSDSGTPSTSSDVDGGSNSPKLDGSTSSSHNSGSSSRSSSSSTSSSVSDAGSGGDMPPDGSGVVNTPAPDGGWLNDTGNLAGIASECGSLTAVFTKPDEDMLIAGIALHGLYGSTNGGGSWTQMGSGTGSATITNRPTAIVYDPTTPHRFWEAGIYNGGGVYVTNDDGVTLTQLGSIGHCDDVSVDFSDANRQTLLAGGHEQSQTLYLSRDGGNTWNNIGSSLPAGPTCNTPLVIDSMTFLIGCYGSGATGIYRSTNGGTSWTLATSSGGGTAPLVASDGSIYWTSNNGSGMTRSTDHGQTWNDTVGSGVFSSPFGHITNGAPVELPDGRIAALGMQYVILSADHGVTWTPATAAVPLGDTEDLHGIAYSAQRKAFYIWHNSCSTTTVPDDAVMSFPFDYTKM